MSRHLRQLKDESNRDYELFCEYHDLGFHRRISTLASLKEISKRTIFSIAKKNNWKERIAKSMEEFVQERQSQFARENKALINEQIERMTLAFLKVKELNMAIDVRLESYARASGDVDEFYDRANRYMTIKLKIQRYENNFYKQLKEFESEEDYELENLEAEIEDFDEENEIEEEDKIETETEEIEDDKIEDENEDVDNTENEIESEEIESGTNNFLNLVPKSATLCNNTFLDHLDNFEVLQLNGSLEYRLRNPSSALQPLPLEKGEWGDSPL